MAVAKKKIHKGEPQPAKKTEKKEKKAEPKKAKLTANKLCRDLLLERKYTDDQITEKVQKVFPEGKFDKAYVSTTRIDLNKGYYKSVEEDLPKNPIPRFVEHQGKVMSFEEAQAIKAEADEKAKAEKETKKAEKKPTGVRTGNTIGERAPVKKALKK